MLALLLLSKDKMTLEQSHCSDVKNRINKEQQPGGVKKYLNLIAVLLCVCYRTRSSPKIFNYSYDFLVSYQEIKYYVGSHIIRNHICYRKLAFSVEPIRYLLLKCLLFKPFNLQMVQYLSCSLFYKGTKQPCKNSPSRIFSVQGLVRSLVLAFHLQPSQDKGYPKQTQLQAHQKALFFHRIVIRQFSIISNLLKTLLPAQITYQ